MFKFLFEIVNSRIFNHYEILSPAAEAFGEGLAYAQYENETKIDH